MFTTSASGMVHVYLDDVSKRYAVLCALHLIEELGPHIGIAINFSKCEVFSPQGNHLFPPAVKSSLLPYLEILGGTER